MNAVIETSLYYEDLIEEYVNDQKDESEATLFSNALRTGKQEWYNREMRMSEKKKESIQSNFRKSMKVDLNTIQKSNTTYDIKDKEYAENEKNI